MYYLSLNDEAAKAAARSVRAWTDVWSMWAQPFAPAEQPKIGDFTWAQERATASMTALTEAWRATGEAAMAMSGASVERNPFGVTGLFASRMNPTDFNVDAAVAAPVKAEAVSKPKAAKKAKAAPKEVSAEPDDLTQIKGVGPKMRETLQAEGIFHFWQIAQLKAKEIETLEEKLGFKGRIARDGWIGQAKTLAKQNA